MIILCSSKPFLSRAASMQPFGITTPKKKPKVDPIHEIKLKGFSGFISWRIIANFSKLRDHYAMQVSKYAFMRWENLSVAFITYHDYSINKLTLPSNLHHLNRFMMKRRETAMPYLQNGFLDLDTMFAPWRSQKSLCKHQDRYWQLIHQDIEIKTWMFLNILRSKDFFDNNYYAKIGLVVFFNLITAKNFGYSIFSAFPDYVYRLLP